MIPKNDQIERSVLGAILQFKTAYYRAAQLIGENSFAISEHKLIWSVIQDIDSKGQTPDLLTVNAETTKKGLDPFYLANLTSGVVTDAYIETWCRILQEFEIRRTAQKAGHELKKKGEDVSEDAFDLLTDMQSEIIELTNIITRGTEANVAQVADEIYKDQINPSNSARGVKISIRDLDYVINGWQPGHLTILAARPGMGKTTLALQQANECLSLGLGVGFISLEMTAKELISKLSAQRSAISHERMKRRELNIDEIDSLKNSLDKIKSGKLFMDDRSSTFVQIRAKVVRWVIEHDIKLVIVDYLQLISYTGKQNREQEISSISRGLKMLAKELNVPVIALSQLSRACETRNPPKPKLSDLRESGAIEQDADEVISMWRPDRYGIEQIEVAKDTIYTENKAEISILKNRHGQAGNDILVYFDTKSVKFDNNEPEQYKRQDSIPF